MSYLEDIVNESFYNRDSRSAQQFSIMCLH